MSNPYSPVEHTELNFHAIVLRQATSSHHLEFTVHFAKPDFSDPKFTEFKETNLFTSIPSKRKYLSHKELEDLVGANPEDIQKVTQYFAQFGIKKGKVNRMARTVAYKGKIIDIDLAFKTQINVYQGGNKYTFLSYEGSLSLPLDLCKIVENITGITVPIKTEYRKPTPRPVSSDADALESTKTPPVPKGYTALQLAEAYSFPTNYSGKGQCIAIIELGGQYKESDVNAYFKMMGLPKPKIEIVGTPLNTDNVLDNSEVTLDIQVAGTIAPNVKIVVYYGHTILEAMKLIIQDKKNKPSVVSISWTGSEYNYSQFQIAELNQVFYEASLLGMTVLGASGDHGTYNSKKYLNVSIPSSSPLVIGCGGTQPILNSENEIQSDAVWNQSNGSIGSGGGFSHIYTKPGYQQIATAYYPYVKSYYRGVPDMSANASGENGYKVIFYGKEMAIGGTSASTPLLAGLISLLNEALGYRLGFINPYLYQCAGSDIFLPVVQGNNGYYPAAPYWNPATGLGSPNGEKLLQFFQELQ